MLQSPLNQGILIDWDMQYKWVFFNYWILYWNLNYFSYSNLSSIKVSQLVMRIFRRYFTCFYTTFTSCVTILFFFYTINVEFWTRHQKRDFFIHGNTRNKLKKCSFVRIVFLVVSLLLWTPRFFTSGTSDKHHHN